MTTKPFYESKTIWTLVVLRALALFCPGVRTYVAEHLDEIIALDLVLTVALRSISKSKLTIGKSTDAAGDRECSS